MYSGLVGENTKVIPHLACILLSLDEERGWSVEGYAASVFLGPDANSHEGPLKFTKLRRSPS
jgi:hypothetical protein